MLKKIKSNKKFWIISAAVFLIAGGVFVYFNYFQPDTQETESAPMQTATVRQGDILVSATGTGTLIPAAEIDVGFGGSGKVTDILVSVGDVVEEGQVLAKLDDTLEQIAFQDAQRDYAELTSPTAMI